MRDLAPLSWSDLRLDAERVAFLELGLASKAGIIAEGIEQEIADVYRARIAAEKLLQGVRQVVEHWHGFHHTTTDLRRACDDYTKAVGEA